MNPSRPAWWHRPAIIVTVVAVVAPSLRNVDSFPLSTYPVYATVRSRTATIVTAFGQRRDGTERRLSMSVIADTDEALIAASRLRDAVAAGTADQLCGEIAARARDDVVTIVVASERHDIVEAARNRPSLLERTVLARCPVTP
jgi:hypothetical protein